MAIDRDVLRSCLPPLLALTLLSLVARPMDVAAVASVTVPATSAPAAVTARTAASTPATSESDGAREGTVRVTIPPVAFTADVAVVHGRLRTPVLLGAPGLTGTARVVGQGHVGRCQVPLVSGQVSWLDCAMPRDRSRALTVVATLSDGRSFSVPVRTR
jgi:hypothetical protein